MSYDINILVNGNRCKQFSYSNKVFIEAKRGSEYTIEIKNSTWQRILAVCSVDGLDILNGKPALKDGPGYVINGYNVGKFDGFRISDEKVAKFVFDYKDASYASSKEDGSEKNVGVIGVRLFAEKVQPPTITWHQWPPYNDPYNDPYPFNYPYPYKPYNPPAIWCGGLSSAANDMGCLRGTTGETIKYSSNASTNEDLYDGTMGSKKKSLSGKITAQCFNMSTAPQLKGNDVRGFDMGTKFGEAKESKVIEVEFARGILAMATNIYYASRQSLIEMGIPLGNEKQVSFPEPFADKKYSTPPKNWKG